MDEDIRFKLEVIRGPHGNPLLLVKFEHSNNFIREKQIINGQEIPGLTWIPTNDEAKLLSDTWRLLNSIIYHLEQKDIIIDEIKVGHD